MCGVHLGTRERAALLLPWSLTLCHVGHTRGGSQIELEYIYSALEDEARDIIGSDVDGERSCCSR